MTNKERIEQVEEHIKAINKELEIHCKVLQELKKVPKEEKKKGLWKPEKGEEYYYLNVNFIDFCKWNGDEFDNFIYLTGNYFKTIEEAEKHLEYLKALGRVRLYILENWYFEPDWDDKKQGKYYIYFDAVNKCFNRSSNTEWKRALLLPYLPSKEACDDVIKNCKKDLEIIFKINQ